MPSPPVRAAAVGSQRWLPTGPPALPSWQQGGREQQSPCSEEVALASHPQAGPQLWRGGGVEKQQLLISFNFLGIEAASSGLHCSPFP